jgi:Cof subfamily protein (haloacid dehalogenase superfamily)
MRKKYVFIDLDGTLMDHETHQVHESTKIALKKARENGHEMILCTGRPPSLLYGIDKDLGFHSIVAANGRVVIYHDEILYENPLSIEAIERLLEISRREGIDLAYEGLHDFALESKHNEIYKKFCDNFHLEYPIYKPGFYKDNKVYQITLFYNQPDFSRFRNEVPSLQIEYSCKYGLDVNTKGGLKEEGIKIFQQKLGIELNDIIAIGDGYNDISMLDYVTHSVAMGNAYDEVKQHASFVTDEISKDGLYKAFLHFDLI